jgi:hypothetical protein
MSELFKDSDVSKPSPRLEWCKRHNLALGQLPDGTRFCAGRNAIGFGATHADAERECAEAMEITHWSIEDFAKAGVIMPEAATEEDWG